MQYAIVDIETTGGSARGSRMTEIAIIVLEGDQIIDRWQTLINPEQNIPLAIFALTGITNEMVKDAPIFADVAAEIYERLQGRIFVAHNVNFDYSFIKHQLEECGYRFSSKKLCTVRLARKIKPGLLSYSLGRLCDYLGIPIQDRHRAGGDADATAILFQRLLAWDEEEVVQQMLKHASPEQRLPVHLDIREFESLPNTPGVYYFHNQAGKVIYVGKAINIKSRVASHFGGNTPNLRRQQFLKEIYHISYEECATELFALLLECAEIKRLWPAYNRALKRFEPKVGLYSYMGVNGYMHLGVGKLTSVKVCEQVFNSEYDAINTWHKLRETYGLDPNFFHIGEVRRRNKFLPAVPPTLREEPFYAVDEHNQRILEALETLKGQLPSFCIMDRGRVGRAEKSCIWVEKGRFYGMGYIPEEAQIRDMEEVRHMLTPYPDNYYMMQLILQYAERNPHKVVSFS